MQFIFAIFFLFILLCNILLLFRVMDPHGQVIGRRRTTSASSRGDHHGGLGALTEDPAEEDQLHDDNSDTISTDATGNLILLKKIKDGIFYILK